MMNGPEKCIWKGADRKFAYKQAGNCDTCVYCETLGVHIYCGAAYHNSGRVNPFDCLVHIKSETKKASCLFCEKHINPKTARCEECLKTEELKNFKLDKNCEWWMNT